MAAAGESVCLAVSRRRCTMVARIGTQIITAPGWTGQPRIDVGLIDCDVHQVIKSPEDLYPYLPRVYKEQLIEQGLRMPGSGYFNIPKNAARTDFAENCDASKHNPFEDGTAYEQLRDEHLNVWNVDYALLTGASTYGASVIPIPTSPPPSAAPSTTGRWSTGSPAMSACSWRCRSPPWIPNSPSRRSTGSAT